MQRRRTVWISLSAIVLVPSLLFLVLAGTQTGRTWLWKRVENWLTEKYQLSLQYESLEISPSAFGWRLDFRDLVWGSFLQNKRETIHELTLDVQPLGYFSGTRLISYARVKGMHLSIGIDADRIDLGSTGYSFRADDLAEILKEKKEKPDESLQAWPDLIMEDVRLDISNSFAEEKQDFRLELAGAWSPKTGLNRFDAASPGFDFVSLGHGLREFSKRSRIFSESSDVWESIGIFQRGRIENLEVRCTTLPNCQGTGWIRNLAWSPKGLIPGVENLSGRLAFMEHTLTLDLAASKLAIKWPEVYRYPFPLALQHTRITLNYDDKNLQILVPSMAFVWKGVTASTLARIEVPRENPKKTRVFVSLRSRVATWPSIRGALPDMIFSSRLNQWLGQKLQGGQVREVSVKVSGEILKFPFASGKGGSFDLMAGFEGVGVSYHEEWPRLDACQAALRIENTKLGIGDIHCRAGSIPDIAGELNIPDFGAEKAEIGARIQIKSGLGAVLSFLNRSPLRKVASFLSSITQGAKAQQTDLQLRVRPGDEERPFEVSGHSTIEELRLLMPLSLYSGLVNRAEVEFDQDGLEKFEGISRSGGDRTKIIIQKNAEDDSLDLSLEPANAARNPLKGRAKLRPAIAPESVEGSLSGLKLSGNAALVRINHAIWKSEPKPLLAFKGLARIKDFGAAARMLSLPSDYGKGQGTIRFDLSLPGIPKGSVAKYLTGTLDIDLTKGQLRNLSQTLTSVLNFANLNVFGVRPDSLSYSFLKGRLKFTNGKMITDDANAGLGALEVEAVGTIDYAKDFMDVNLVIIPDLGSPLVAGSLALWNPLVGLTLIGISIFQKKASDSRLNRAVSQTYKLKGTIDDPAISLIRPMDPMELLKND